MDAIVSHTCHLILVHETLTKGCTMPDFSGCTVYLSLTQPAEYQQQPITADGHFSKQQTTMVDEIWYWPTVTIKLY